MYFTEAFKVIALSLLTIGLGSVEAADPVGLGKSCTWLLAMFDFISCVLTPPNLHRHRQETICKDHSLALGNAHLTTQPRIY